MNRDDRNTTTDDPKDRLIDDPDGVHYIDVSCGCGVKYRLQRANSPTHLFRFRCRLCREAVLVDPSTRS